MNIDRQIPWSGRPFLNTPQAAHYLGLSSRHLERLRSRGLGPVSRRHSRFVVYHIDDLDAWSLAHISGDKADA
jgi:hypothetical protein